MQKAFFILVGLILLFPQKVSAQTHPLQISPLEEVPPERLQINPEQNYYTGEILKIVEQQKHEFNGEEYFTQVLLVQAENGTEVEVEYGSEFQPLNESQLMTAGDSIVLNELVVGNAEPRYMLADSFRLPILAWLLVGFFLVVLTVAGLKGVFSIAGMFLSLGVLASFVVPQILSGTSPLLVTMVGAVVIAGITVYLSHGFKSSSHIALASILLTLLGITLLSTWFVDLAHLSGFGSEEAAFLQVGETARINLQGLLLSGIMLGALGVLDDITISQVATVFELKRANKKLPFKELYERGMRVGRDHVASLVNTLVLAYAGANLPLFLLFSLNEQIPLWVKLNYQFIAEEVVRTLMGSIGLVLAVPLATVLAAYWASERTVSDADIRHSHS